MNRYSVFACALLLAGCGRTVPQGAAVDPAIASLIPPQTVVLAGVNVAELQKTKLYEKLIASRAMPPELDEFARRTGLDVKRDLKRFYAASDGKQNLMIAEVDLKDPAAIEREIEAKGAKRTQAGGKTVLETNGNAVCFLGGGKAVAGPVDLVRAAAEGSLKGDDANRKAVLQKMAALPANSQIWAVSVGGVPPMPIPERGNLANLNRVFASLQTTTLSADLSDGIALTARGECADEKSARQLHDTLRGLVGFGRLSTPADKPEFLRVLDGIEIAQDKLAVNVKARVPADLVETLTASYNR